MEQVQSEEAQEQAEVWEEAVGAVEWGEIVPEQAPAEIVFAQVVVQKHLIR